MLNLSAPRSAWRVFLVAILLISAFTISAVATASNSQQNASTTVAIAVGAGASLTSQDGSVTVTVPDSAPSTAGTLSHMAKSAADAPAPAPTGKVFGTTLFDLSVLDVGGSVLSTYAFSDPITISVTYTNVDLQAAEGDPSRLAVYKYDTAFQAWTPLATSFDPATKTVQARATRLGFFALMGQARPATPTPTPTGTPLPGAATATPTVTPTSPPPTATTAPAPTATLVPPSAGDIAPGSGLLMGMLLVAAMLLAAGGYYLRQSRQS